MFLDHHWMTEENLERFSNGDPEDEEDANRRDEELKRLLTLSESQKAILKDRDRHANYADPLAERLREISDPDASKYEDSWLAAFSRVQEPDWIAIVQERRSRVVAPMLELYGVFLRYGLLTLIVFSLVLALLWGLIQRVSQAGLRKG
jgi:hypothetical protein